MAVAPALSCEAQNARRLMCQALSIRACWFRPEAKAPGGSSTHRHGPEILEAELRITRDARVGRCCDGLLYRKPVEPEAKRFRYTGLATLNKGKLFRRAGQIGVQYGSEIAKRHFSRRRQHGRLVLVFERHVKKRSCQIKAEAIRHYLIAAACMRERAVGKNQV